MTDQPRPAFEACYRGPNGVEVTVYDESAPYVYANIYHLKLRVVARVPGSSEPYERMLERMGVYAEELDRARRELLDGFEDTTLPYLFALKFPRNWLNIADDLAWQPQVGVRWAASLVGAAPTARQTPTGSPT